MPLEINKLTTEELIMINIMISARRIQEFLWGNMNSEAGLEEYKRMLRKRLAKIEKIETTNPHWKIELKKRLLQISTISVQVINKLNNDDLEDGIHPTLPSNLDEYAKEIQDNYDEYLKRKT